MTLIVDALRPAVNFGAWDVTVEYTDMEDNQPIDFATFDHVTLEMEDPFSRQVVMVLNRDTGITTPVPGIIEWHVTRGQMGGFRPGTYRVRLYAWDTDQNETLALMDSLVSVVGD